MFNFRNFANEFRLLTRSDLRETRLSEKAPKVSQVTFSVPFSPPTYNRAPPSPAYPPRGAKLILLGIPISIRLMWEFHFFIRHVSPSWEIFQARVCS